MFAQLRMKRSDMLSRHEKHRADPTGNVSKSCRLDCWCSLVPWAAPLT